MAKQNAMVSVRSSAGTVVVAFGDGTTAQITGDQIAALPLAVLTAAATKGISEALQDAPSQANGLAAKKAAVLERLTAIKGGSWATESAGRGVSILPFLIQATVEQLEKEGKPEKARNAERLMPSWKAEAVKAYRKTYAAISARAEELAAAAKVAATDDAADLDDLF